MSAPAGQYDVMLVGAEPLQCDCGTRVWGGEIVWFERRGRLAQYGCCLACAHQRNAPPVPVELVLKASRMTRDFFALAMAGALTSQPAHKTHFDFD